MTGIIKMFGLVPWLAGKLMKRKPSLDDRQAGILATALSWAVIVLLVVILLRSCGDGRQEAEQAKQDARSNEALADTAEIAVEAVIARAESDATVDQIVAQAIQEIDNAPTDQDAGNAARAAICGLPDYRNDPACRVQPVHP